MVAMQNLVRSFARLLLAGACVTVGAGCPRPPGGAEVALAWRRVVHAALLEELLVGLGYSAGYAQCVSATFPTESSSWQLANCLANAAKTFAALLRSPVPLDVGPCVRVYRSELRALLELVAQEVTLEAARTAC